jgi:ribulose-5-phosphate 4-epimerase/fuculose-1-phosphate aldolase
MVEEVKAKGPYGFVLFHPMMGGIPPEMAWESLRLFEEEVLPHLEQEPVGSPPSSRRRRLADRRLDSPRDNPHTNGGTAMHGTRSGLTHRQQLAVTCRTLAMQGYDDKLAGHVSVRDGHDGTLIVPRVGVFWDEIRPNDFVRIDRHGVIVEGEGALNPTIVFHLELHKARPDIRCAVHNHPPYGTAWACAAALPPVYDQSGANGGGKAVVYSEYEGVVQTSDAAAALARA